MAKETSSESYQKNYAKLQEIAQKLSNSETIDIDELVPMVDEATRAYQVCQSRIEAVEAALNKRLEVEEKENEEKFLFMATRKGIIKKVGLSCFDNIRRSGMKAIGLDKDDFLGWVSPVSRNDEIVLVTSNGQAIRFKEKDARKTGRPARGIRGIRLRKEDRVVSMDVVEKGDEAGREVLVVTQKGYGKRTVLAKYSCQKRGGSGLKTSQTTLKIGNVVSAKVTGKEDTQVLFASRHAQVICLKLNNIPSLSRVTQGVRLMRLSENDEVSSMTVL
ncbi:MAG: exodeoxyribonuclease VII small subunit [Piscirickettsiaceae bacterium CG_4_10_14_0_2_um_filter_44_336]|nr:MAG: exodeoxyribonuclease VII small subunit [Piscirickettsiaceae bacterium CG_4_10_14_0_2_um_filter_44_336]